jgi:hypothetical protein
MFTGVCNLLAQKLSSQSDVFHISSNEPCICTSGIHPVLEEKKSGSKSMSVDVVVAGTEEDCVSADNVMGTDEGQDENTSEFDPPLVECEGYFRAVEGSCRVEVVAIDSELSLFCCGCSIPKGVSRLFLFPNVDPAGLSPPPGFIPSTSISRFSALQHLPAKSHVCPTIFNASRQFIRCN